MNLSTEMDAIGTALATITGLRVFDFPPKAAQPPFAFCDLPESMTYDYTMARGKDSATVQVFVGVASANDRNARDQIAAYLAGSGSSSIKAAVDSSGRRRVTSATVGPIEVAGVTYVGAVFSVEVTA